jgi:LysM repeat protein
MPKDLKIGLFLGLVLVTAAAIWLAVQSQSMRGQKQSYELVEHSQPSDNVVSRLKQAPQADTHDKKAQAAATQENGFHIIREGETLSLIASRYYGSAGNWLKIYNANSNIIKDANVLRPGTKIVIPK